VGNETEGNPPKVAIRLKQEVFNKNIFTKLYLHQSSLKGVDGREMTESADANYYSSHNEYL
jgi:hypothetical protein